MPTKYYPIAQFLSSIPSQSSGVTLTFDEVVQILGFPLPASAYKHPEWWSYEQNPKQSQKMCWQGIGWRADGVNFSRNEVQFLRMPPTSTETAAVKPSVPAEIQGQKTSSDINPIEIGADLTVAIKKAAWVPVFVIPKESNLVKGRHGVYHSITHAAAEIPYRFGCYSWGSSSCIHYCGSFAQDYVRGGFKSNLQARVHNYLQNHRVKPTGQKNTNLMVFEKINEALLSEDVYLSVLLFEQIIFAGISYSFSQYCEDPDLVHMVEQFLIAFYRKHEQCCWNRT